jgi:hypothetical protein
VRWLFTPPGAVAALLVLISVLLMLMVTNDYVEVRQLRDHGIEVSATVHGITLPRRSGSVTVDFTTREGADVTARIGFRRWNGTPQLGETKTLVYHPGDPQNMVMDPDVSFVHVFDQREIFLAIGLLAFGVMIWRRTRVDQLLAMRSMRSTPTG